MERPNNIARVTSEYMVLEVGILTDDRNTEPKKPTMNPIRPKPIISVTISVTSFVGPKLHQAIRFLA
jgi:hypothetical protein